MIESLKIEGYRGFEKLEVEGLRRVNLFVGKNGSGKTALLEAIELVAEGQPNPLLALDRRGEFHVDLNDPKTCEYEIKHLYNGHRIEPESKFILTTKNDDSEEVLVEYKISLSKPTGVFGLSPLEMSMTRYCGSRQQDGHGLQLEKGDCFKYPRQRIRQCSQFRSHPEIQTSFVATGVCDPIYFQTKWDKMIRANKKTNIVTALQILDKEIEQVEMIGDGKVVVKRVSVKKLVPIGSLGEGMSRMLDVAVSLAASPGVLLIDEIDIGFHYSVLEDMWRMILATAEKLDVQVFATTHSQDCVRAFAAVCDNNKVSLHRVEEGREKTIPYSEDMIKAAAEHGIEVR